MTSEKRAQKFHTDDASLPRSGSASDWLNQISHAARPIRSTTQIWVVTCHQYGISALVSQMSFGGETSGSVAKCRLFFQATCCYRRLPIAFPDSNAAWVQVTQLLSSEFSFTALLSKKFFNPLKETKSLILRSSSQNSLISCSLK